MMGGGPTTPDLKSSEGKKEKTLVLAVLPWPEKVVEPVIKALESEFEDIEVRFFYSQFENGKFGSVDIPEDILNRTTYLITFFWLPKTASALPQTKFIQFVSAGTNHIANHPIYTSSPLPLCSANGVHGPQIAEWVVMMNLVHSHRYPVLYDAQKAHRWNQKDGMKVSDRVGKRVGILGYGSIGRQVARACKALGMDVIAYTASPRNTPESRRDTGFIVPGTGDPEGELPSRWFSGTGTEALHEFLRQEIDLLVVGVPLTKSTTHLLSTPEFELLHASNPRGTYVANIARGQVIDSDALVAALEKGLVAGAALDVTDPEPLPEDHALWDAPNCLITPHVSGSSDSYTERAFEVLKENIRRERSGRKLVNEVNRERGY